MAAASESQLCAEGFCRRAILLGCTGSGAHQWIRLLKCAEGVPNAKSDLRAVAGPERESHRLSAVQDLRQSSDANCPRAGGSMRGKSQQKKRWQKVRPRGRHLAETLWLLQRISPAAQGERISIIKTSYLDCPSIHNLASVFLDTLDLGIFTVKPLPSTHHRCQHDHTRSHSIP